MKSQAEKAQEFRELHGGRNVLVLPNGWDVPSCRIFEDAGFPAVVTSSAGMMVSLGYPDGEVIDRDQFVAAVKRIAGVLSVPLSVDVVAGFGGTASEVSATVKMIIEAGAIGINIEDFVHASKKMLPIEGQVEKLKTLKSLAGSVGVPFVINARTDALRFAPGDDASKEKEAISRCIAFRDAGADCVYPQGLVDADAIKRFVGALDFPINVMVRKGLPPVAELKRLGVARVSFGPGASYAAMGLLKRAAKEVMEKGTYQALVEGAISFDELDSLASPKKR